MVAFQRTFLHGRTADLTTPLVQGAYDGRLYPLRRTLDRPWGAFILRIGGKDNEEHFLDRNPPQESDDIRPNPKYLAIPAQDESENLGEILTPTRDGELFMYLNKPIIRWLSHWIGNTGTATVTIEPL
jgi:hypothetical protein